MSGLTKPIDVTRPEDYELRSGKEVIALFECLQGEVLVVYNSTAGQPEAIHIRPNGRFSEKFDSKLDLIEKSKKMWRSLYKSYAYSPWLDSKSEADNYAGISDNRVGYITCTDRNDPSTYELVPLEGDK